MSRKENSMLEKQKNRFNNYGCGLFYYFEIYNVNLNYPIQPVTVFYFANKNLAKITRLHVK